MTKKLKKTAKAGKKISNKDEAINANMRTVGAVMSLASVLMALLPMMYMSVYKYIAAQTHEFLPNGMTTGFVAAGFIVALLYFLLAIFIVRAGENNTRLAKGVYYLNFALFIVSVIAGVMLFSPWPVPTFRLAMNYFAIANEIPASVISMFIMLFVDMALIVGLLGASSTVIRASTVRKKS